MDSVGIRELKRDTSAIIKKVREGKEQIEVTFRGEVVARIVPVESSEPVEGSIPVESAKPVESAEERRKRISELFERMDELTELNSRSVVESSESNIVERLRDERQRVLEGER